MQHDWKKEKSEACLRRKATRIAAHGYAKVRGTRAEHRVSSMPIWSEVPWGTAITLVIAVYGAALSTLNFLRAGPKLRLNVRPGMVLVPSDDKRTFIQTEVTNFGDRPTTLTNIGIRYFEKPWSWEHLRNRATKAAVLNDPNPAQRFPFELKPGGVWRGLTPQEPQLVDWGLKGALYFDLYHSHRTKPMRKRVRF